MSARRNKRGQVAIFLVLILAGLAMLIALNMDVFTSARAKTRLQNAADASALALARWQAISLNLIGELNLAHLVAVNESNATAMASIVGLQRRIAFIGPTLGLKEANDIARQNGVPVSENMTEAVRLLQPFLGAYGDLLDDIIREGIRAGVDNAAIISAASQDPRFDPLFYEAIANRDFRTLCLRYADGSHRLPSVPADLPNPDDVTLAGGSASFGYLGIGWRTGDSVAGQIANLVRLADLAGVEPRISAGRLSQNAALFFREPWCLYDGAEWYPFPDEFSFPRFPWLSPLKSAYNVTGGSATIRIEGEISLASIAAQTNAIAAQAAAKALGAVNGQRVSDVSPALVMPCFSCVRLVPFGPGAAGRYGMSNLATVRSLLGLLGKSGGDSGFSSLLKEFGSSEFRDLAEQWYSQHGHTDADGCRPPTSGGPERGGGTPYGI